MILYNRNIDLELISDSFYFPTELTFDTEGIAYIAESGITFNGRPDSGRIWRIEKHDNRSLVADGFRPPINGLTFHDVSIYVSEGGFPGRIQKLNSDGHQTVILDNLPGPGNYHTNMVAFGPDDKMYFSQGAMTNTGIIGLDGYDIGWLRRLPHAHDIPGYDIVLAGVNVETINPLSKEQNAQATTGAFAPFGLRGLDQVNKWLDSFMHCWDNAMRAGWNES